MKLPFQAKNEETQPAQNSIKPVPVTYATELRYFLQRNAPTDFENKFAAARPFIFASFIAWPTFWLYRGLNWSNKRKVQRLSVYINRTFLQAKIMQVAIMTAGVILATRDTAPIVKNINNFFRGYNYPGYDDDEINDKK